MFRLKATLVATTVLRPWRTGWSVDRGVDFSLAAAAPPTIAVPAPRDDTVAAERACFIDEDGTLPSGVTGARCFAALAAEAIPEPGSEDVPESSGVRAWWSLASKPSRT